MSRRLAPAVAAATVLIGATQAHAACNLIPGTIRAYDGIRGTANRPFAAPGERVGVGLRDCDAGSPRSSERAGNSVSPRSTS
jgi:hypothetical protein